jgi:hypothetical protein
MTDTIEPPKIEGAPGLAWKPRLAGWEARWQARTDLVRRGYVPKSIALWKGRRPTEEEVLWIISRCQMLQDSMLAWGRGGHEVVEQFGGDIRSLIAAYETDPDSPYKALRYHTRENYGSLTRRIMRDHGHVRIEDIKGRDVRHWHKAWAADGKIAMSHALVGMLRTLCTFGKTILDDPECARISSLLSDMRFTMPKPRGSHLAAEQADAVRRMAHTMGLHSLALAQAFQFDLMLRQKDVIGEWVPLSEPGISEIVSGNRKWLRGLRWEEIDANMELHHVTSKRNKALDVPLKDAPMVMAELKAMGELPTSGPIIVSDLTGIPWESPEFRRQWRKAADACGIPKTVRNMDSRAGAISEATDAGADLEHVRHAATHSDIATTQRYSRNAAAKVAGVMQLRAAHRNKSGTGGGNGQGNVS